MVDFASAIIKLRTDRNITQTQFADVLGVSQVTVARWETGARRPNDEMIARIKSAFCVRLEIAFVNG